MVLNILGKTEAILVKLLYHHCKVKLEAEGGDENPKTD